MVILAIESSAPSASAAVVKDGKVLSSMSLNVGLTHSVTLLPLVHQALDGACLTMDDVDAVAVTNGPGSFTGVRIGVSLAKGLAQPGQKQCVPVSTLEAIAYPLIDSECIAAAVMDARCSQVYCALFDCADGVMTRLTEDEAIPIDSLIEKTAAYHKKIVLIGDGAELVFKTLSGRIPRLALASPFIRFQNAASVALLAEQQLSEKKNICTPEDLVPTYLRMPQAERELKKKKENPS